MLFGQEGGTTVYLWYLLVVVRLWDFVFFVAIYWLRRLCHTSQGQGIHHLVVRAEGDLKGLSYTLAVLCCVPSRSAGYVMTWAWAYCGGFTAITVVLAMELLAVMICPSTISWLLWDYALLCVVSTKLKSHISSAFLWAACCVPQLLAFVPLPACTFVLAGAWWVVGHGRPWYDLVPLGGWYPWAEGEVVEEAEDWPEVVADEPQPAWKIWATCPLVAGASLVSLYQSCVGALWELWA